MTIFRSKLTLAVLMMAAVVGPTTTATAQAAAQQRTYTVKPGDTLMSIARDLFGDASRWKEISELNELSDPSRIYPGQVLKLAADAAAEPSAPRPPAAREPAPTPPDIKTPERQVERPAVILQEPAEPAQEPARDSLFVRRRGIDAYTALRTYREQPYKPLRVGEFYSSGFLTEGQALPFGRVLGTVTPQQIRNLSERSPATLYSTIAVLPPEGADYQPADSLLLVETFQGPPGYGEIVYPTGMARVTGRNGRQVLATVVAVYGAIRNGQLALPAERFTPGGTTRAEPVENGVVGRVLGQRDVRELKHPQNVLFLDVGRSDGVAPGDIVEIRRDPEPRAGASDTIDELMATLQVVHVRENTASARIISVVSPDIPPGARVVQVAKLP